jgi:2-aminoadipate transaminase
VYGLLSYDGEAPPALKAEDRSGLVIYLTSLSKVLMPGLRLGVLLAASPILEALIAAKRVADLHSPGLLQRACAEYLARDQMHQHLRATRRLYRERRDYLDREMKRALPATATWSVPSGGLCLWLQLPPGLRSMDLYPQAIERGVAFAPGEVFFPGPPTSGYLRISWAAHDQQTLHTATGVLGELLHEYEARRTRLEARSLGAGRAMV